MLHFTAQTLDDWRPQARDMITRGILPHEVGWSDAEQISLFNDTPPLPPIRKLALHVPPEFFDLARAVGCHRDARRWDLLYQLLWRLTHGEKYLLRISTDPLMHALRMMEKAVRRDAHKMKAFVRFRCVQDGDGEHYIAWHRPDHRIVRYIAPFFMRRFTAMKWTILTSDESVHWDLDKLHFGPGVAEADAPQDDVMEDLWRDYYRAIFNPARIKIKAMKREMPVRHWQTLPETRIIASMLAEAPERVEKMIAHTEGSTISAENFMPPTLDLGALRTASKACEGCELHSHATQTVFGVGPANARLMLIGEQPGDEEDKQGIPFVGPAGQILDQALAAANLSREDIYITNAVKHFRFLYQDSFRQHQSPSRFHVHACKPWLNAEIAAVKPRAILCLGNTAARALVNPNFVMKDNHGKWLAGEPPLMATYHPSAILRAQGQQQNEFMQYFAEDLFKAGIYSSLG